MEIETVQGFSRAKTFSKVFKKKKITKISNPKFLETIFNLFQKEESIRKFKSQRITLKENFLIYSKKVESKLY
jgi:hypothetical protein